MILVQNHLPRSNGNKYLWVFALTSILLIFSCSPFKSGVDPGAVDSETESSEEELVYNPRSKSFERPTKELILLDSVEWIDIQTEPITTGEIISKLTSRPYSEKKQSYNLSLLLPINAERVMVGLDRESVRNSRFLQFYLGFKIGLSELSEVGLNFKVDVFDISNVNTSVDDLIKEGALSNSDLLMGPYRKSDLVTATEYAFLRNIPLVSPWSSLKSVTTENPNYLLMKPGIEEHCKALYKYITDNFEDETVTLIGREQNRGIINFIQDLHAEENSGERLNEHFLQDTSISLELTNFDSLLSHDQANVFFVPEYEPGFVYSFLRSINIARAPNELEFREEREVHIFGLPQWALLQRIDYDYFEDMHIHISNPGYLDFDDPDVKFFKKRFASQFGLIPTEDAFDGYDMVRFLGTMLHKYGKNFFYYLDQEEVYLLYSGFRVERDLIAKPNSIFPQINCFENKHVDILKFENYEFKRVR